MNTHMESSLDRGRSRPCTHVSQDWKRYLDSHIGGISNNALRLVDNLNHRCKRLHGVFQVLLLVLQRGKDSNPRHKVGGFAILV